MSNKATTAFSRTAGFFARRFGWACAATLATLGIAPHADAASSEPPSAQSVQVNSIPERLRIVRERLGTEGLQNVHHAKQLRFTQWYKGR
jgi:hypothetical protein